ASDAKASPPGFRPIHADVELGDLSLFTRCGFRNTGHQANGFQHSGCGELEPRRLRTLHVDVDRPSPTAEDRLLALDGRTNARNLAELDAKVVLNGKQIPFARGFRPQLDEDVAVVRRAAESTAGRQVREIHLGLCPKKAGDLASLLHRVFDARPGRYAIS